MEFDRLLEQYDAEGQKEVVGLAIYYIENFEEEPGATPSEVGELLEASRSSVSKPSVSTYLNRLDDWVTNTANGGYQLTHKGEQHVERALDDALFNEPRSDKFLDTSDLDEDDYYRRLVDDINSCYQNHIPDATLVMSRKLFEHLIYKILMGHFSGEDPNMYFDTDRRRALGFKQLVSNFEDNITLLRQYSRDLDEDVAEAVEWFREQGNTGAHSIRVDVSEEELEERSKEATRAVEILYDVWVGVQIQSDGEDDN